MKNRKQDDYVLHKDFACVNNFTFTMDNKMVLDWQLDLGYGIVDAHCFVVYFLYLFGFSFFLHLVFLMFLWKKGDKNFI